MKSRLDVFLAIGALCVAAEVQAGFSSLEQFLAAVGRISGQGGAQFYTTVWATNLTGAPVSFTFEFLKQGQANPSPPSFSDNLTPGETKVYENVVESKLGLSNTIGAARVTSSGEILVSERIYNQAPGADVGDTEGLFFAGVPKSFSISAGQSASIQGINQGGDENFRYNFALVETGGGSPTVNVQLFDGSGTMLGQKAYTLQPYEQIQPSVADIVSSIHTTNARITATVTSGTGSALIAGAQLANESQDSSGFEMSFRDSLLGGGGAAGVTSLNGLTGGLTIAHGANTTVNVNGSTITIDAVSGSGSGLTAVAHDNSLAGSGTVGLPLGIANGQVVRSLNGLHDAVTLTAGNNVTLTPSGNTITIAATGGTGGGGSVSSVNGETGAVTLAAGSNVSITPAGNTITIASTGGGGGVTSLNSLTGALSLTAGTGISVTPSGSSISIGYTGGGSSGLTSVTHDTSLTGAGTGASPLAVAGGGVSAAQLNGAGSSAGQVLTSTGAGVAWQTPSGGGGGLTAVSHDSSLIGSGTAGSPLGVAGSLSLSSSGTAFTASSSGGSGVLGKTTGGSGAGVLGQNANGNAGELGTPSYGIYGTSASGTGIWGATTGGSGAGVVGQNTNGNMGELGSPSYAVYGTSGSGTGIWGTTTGGAGAGVVGQNTNTNIGELGTPSYGVYGKASGNAIYGETSGGSAAGVQGHSIANSTDGYLGGPGYGVAGSSANSPGILGLTSSGSTGAIRGHHNSSGCDAYLGGPDYGIYATCSGHFGGVFDQGVSVQSGILYVVYQIHDAGDLNVDGSKNFVAPHPSDPSKTLVFTCLEGNESGTYFRGTARTVNGFATIEVPESFRLVTSPDGLSAVVSPIGELAVLAVVSQDLHRIVVQSSRDVAFNYIVNGIRAGFEKHETIAENTFFVPTSARDTNLSKLNPEAVRRLKANGTLNADGTVNLETAHRLGWDRRPEWNDQARQPEIAAPPK